MSSYCSLEQESVRVPKVDIKDQKKLQGTLNIIFDIPTEKYIDESLLMILLI